MTSGARSAGITVELKAVRFGYRHAGDKMPGRGLVLDDFDLACPAGAITAILGRSGCGKSTILDLIAGLRTPSAGKVELARHGTPVRPRIGFIFQDGNCLPWLTVKQNVLFAVKRAARDVDDVLGRSGLIELRDRYPAQLSGGQQQRVAIGRLLMRVPDLVLCDEPWSSLDIGSRRAMEAEVRELIHNVKATGIVVTHEPAEAIRVADEVIVLGGSPLSVLQRCTVRDVDRADSAFIESFTHQYLDLLDGATTMSKGYGTPC